MTVRMAIAQITMHWSVEENVAEILRAMNLARAGGAQLCAFSELAVTGYHRHIDLAIAIGAPTFGEGAKTFNSHLLLNERGETTAVISKRGLTEAEATFFAAGSSRPVGQLQGLKCSAVICREISDLDQVSTELQPGMVQVIFVPGALRQDPEIPRTDPPEYVQEIQRLAAAVSKLGTACTFW